MDAQMKLMKLPTGASYVSLVDKLCDEKGCLTMTGPDIETDLLVWDYGHLTLTGSQWVADRVVKPPLLEALGVKER